MTLALPSTAVNGLFALAAIEFVEQTPPDSLSPTKIWDAEGIKQVTELTSNENIKENQFARDKEKTDAVEQERVSREVGSMK